MTMNSTSLKAYHEEVKPNKETMQAKVLDLIKRAKRPVCNQEIAYELGLEINRVTGRVHELVEKGKLKQAFKAQYPPTQRTVTYWRLTEKCE